MRLKTDSLVVETEVHFPTDYNLLWDSARKCIDLAGALDIPGWRKSKHWGRKLKGLMRTVGKTSSRGGPNKSLRALQQKVGEVLATHIPDGRQEKATLERLSYYWQMLTKHIDLVERRLIKGEKIPHEEKIFSVFQPWTELIKKGKSRPNLEFGKNVAITSDQYQLILDWQIAERQTDSELTLPIGRRLVSNYRVASRSVDRGFSDMADKVLLEQWIPQVIMPKKGRRSQTEKAIESAPAFRRLKNKHSAVESNINELEHRGLDRCPDRTRGGFNRYVGLAVTAYNLHKIGRELLRQRWAEAQRREAA